MNYDFITKHLEVKTGRFLVPELRQVIEENLFIERVIPQAFIEKDLQKMVCLVANALESMKIREVGGNNMGQVVGEIQSVIGGIHPGGDRLPWCMDLAQVLVAFIEDWCGVQSPVPISQGVLQTWNIAKQIEGLTSVNCEVGTICCTKHDASWMGHALIVMQNGPSNMMMTFEGNTNYAGSRDGDGAYFRTRDKQSNGNLKTLGFVRIYPNNQIPEAT